MVQALVASYLGRENMESLQKTLPFFVKEEEKKALEKRKSRKKSWKSRYGSFVWRPDARRQRKTGKNFRNGNRRSESFGGKIPGVCTRKIFWRPF